MKIKQIGTKIEVFVCNHKDCAERGSKDLTDKLKKWAKEEHKGEIKVYRSGCLSECSDGIAVACYPSKKMLLKVSEDDFKTIKKGLEEALGEIKTE